MADISMCHGIGCNVRTNCYRHTAKASNWQSYISPELDERGKCDHYWPNEVKPESKSQAKRLDTQMRKKKIETA